MGTFQTKYVIKDIKMVNLSSAIPKEIKSEGCFVDCDSLPCQPRLPSGHKYLKYTSKVVRGLHCSCLKTRGSKKVDVEPVFPPHIT